MIRMMQANAKGFLNIYFIMYELAHDEADYCFCPRIKRNFDISKIFELNAILHLNRTPSFIRRP